MQDLYPTFTDDDVRFYMFQLLKVRSSQSHSLLCLCRPRFQGNGAPVKMGSQMSGCKSTAMEIVNMYDVAKRYRASS